MSKFLVYFLSFFVNKGSRQAFRSKNNHRNLATVLFLLRNTLVNKINIIHKAQKKREFAFQKSDTRDIKSLKIIVVYHKPAELFANKCFVAVNSGRQDMAKPRITQYGTCQNDELAQEWLLKNTIGDNTGENISSLNHRVGVLSALYWVRHNMDKIGDPNFVGACNYSKFLHHNALECFSKYDICTQYKTKFFTSLKKEFIQWHGEFFYNKALEIFNSLNQEMSKRFEKYMCCHSGYYNDNFIMRKDLFFELIDFVSPLAIKIYKQLPETEPRDIAYFIERLNGFFIYDKIQQGATFKEFTMFDWYK